GIDFLGIGYDLLNGNPHGDVDTPIDPGFRAPVVSLTYCEGDDTQCATRDLRDLQPIEGWDLPEFACTQAES
ncbi:uncharacterized protein MICPUCDRAFT_11783, partial [Micromonas pusilla CCMP1545]